MQTYTNTHAHIYTQTHPRAMHSHIIQNDQMDEERKVRIDMTMCDCVCVAAAQRNYTQELNGMDRSTENHHPECMRRE